jgi:hypothetical protein
MTLRDDVLAEVVAGAGGVGVADQLLEEKVAVEDVDAHRCQGASSRPGMVGGSAGFSTKLRTRLSSSTPMTPSSRARSSRHLDAADGHIGTGSRHGRAIMVP